MASGHTQPRPRSKRKQTRDPYSRRGLFFALHSNYGVEPDDEGPADAAEDAAEGVSESSEP